MTPSVRRNKFQTAKSETRRFFMEVFLLILSQTGSQTHDTGPVKLYILINSVNDSRQQ